MAPKRNTKLNGFMIFVHDWMAKQENHIKLNDAVTAAGKIWSTMSPQQRANYKNMAQDSRRNEQLCTCTGIPIMEVQRERDEQLQKEKRMNDITKFIVQCDNTNALSNHVHCFIMVNYFIKTLNDDVYLPAELSICQYSLKVGVISIYHTLINPDVSLYGQRFEASKYSEETHKLPTPPNALGDSDLAGIYNAIVTFIRSTIQLNGNKSSQTKLPPVYTLQESIPVIQSSLEFLKMSKGAVDEVIDVFSIENLFYSMKDMACKLSGLESPKNSFVTTSYFLRDYFEYQSGISCTFHEERDCTKYCTQSYTTRWSYTFSDYICRDVNIIPIPGRHIPKSTDLNAVIISPITDVKVKKINNVFSLKCIEKPEDKVNDTESRKHTTSLCEFNINYSSVKLGVKPKTKNSYDKTFSSSKERNLPLITNFNRRHEHDKAQFFIKEKSSKNQNVEDSISFSASEINDIASLMSYNPDE